MPTARQPGGLSDELDPYVDKAEAERFDRVGELLRSQHPVPARNLLGQLSEGPGAEAPPAFRARAALALLVGILLLGLALLGASGSGPLGG